MNTEVRGEYKLCILFSRIRRLVPLGTLLSRELTLYAVLLTLPHLRVSNAQEPTETNTE